jgi:hypothetical protein
VNFQEEIQAAIRAEAEIQAAEPLLYWNAGK